jgi:hypothetical protein
MNPFRVRLFADTPQPGVGPCAVSGTSGARKPQFLPGRRLPAFWRNAVGFLLPCPLFSVPTACWQVNKPAAIEPNGIGGRGRVPADPARFPATSGDAFAAEAPPTLGTSPVCGVAIRPGYPPPHGFPKKSQDLSGGSELPFGPTARDRRGRSPGDYGKPKHLHSLLVFSRRTRS